MQVTSGKWRVSGNEVVSVVDGYEVICVSPFQICEGSEYTGSWVEYETNEANMRLIASAPKMQSAILHTLQAINSYPDRNHPMTASEAILREALLASGWRSE